MSEDRITCTLCNLTWTIPENLELNHENHEKFKCLCQKPPAVGYYFIKCHKHNFGQWVSDSRRYVCKECDKELESKKYARFTMSNFKTIPTAINPMTSPYEMEQHLKTLEAPKK